MAGVIHIFICISSIQVGSVMTNLTLNVGQSSQGSANYVRW